MLLYSIKTLVSHLKSAICVKSIVESALMATSKLLSLGNIEKKKIIIPGILHQQARLLIDSPFRLLSKWLKADSSTYFCLDAISINEPMLERPRSSMAYILTKKAYAI